MIESIGKDMLCKKKSKPGYLLVSSVFFLELIAVVLLGQTIFYFINNQIIQRKAQYYQARSMAQIAEKLNKDEMIFNLGITKKNSGNITVTLKNGRQFTFE